MRFILSIIIIATISFFLGLYFPWWTIAIVAFAVSVLIPLRPASAFISGFLAIFLLWTIMAAFINSSNAGILASRIGQLLGVGSSASMMVFVTGLVGGLVGGLASLAASFLRRPIKRAE